MDKQKLKIFLLAFIFYAFINNQVFAENIEKNELQSKCFNTLKLNISEIWIFEKPYQVIKKMNYNDIKFSRYYKNMSSFWIDLDKPLFEIRLYSFWKQSWYIHPPYSPFAIWTKSEKWDFATKEYIIAEEYIKIPNWNKQFISCSFMQLSAEDLMKVKAEDYLYDWEIISLLKNNNNLEYKAWYNENVSYNYENKILWEWNRLFIYPKETQNDYFDRYKIANSFPTNISTNFDALNKEKIKDKWIWDWPIRVYIQNENWKIQKYISPSELSPIKQQWNNKIFPLFWYYQDIENSFPEFSKNIALRWELHFDTLKKIISTKENSKYAHIWNTILYSKDFTKYMKAKKDWNINKIFQSWEVDFYEKNEKLIWNFEKEIQNLSNKEINKNEFKINDNIYDNIIENNNKANYILYITIIFILFSFIWFIIFKRKK